MKSFFVSVWNALLVGVKAADFLLVFSLDHARQLLCHSKLVYVFLVYTILYAEGF